MRFLCFVAERLELMYRHLLPVRGNWGKTSLFIAVVEDEPTPLEAFADRRSNFAHVPSVRHNAPLGAEIYDAIRRRAPIRESALRQLRLNCRHVPASAVGIRESPLSHESAAAPVVAPYIDVAQ